MKYAKYIKDFAFIGTITWALLSFPFASLIADDEDLQLRSAKELEKIQVDDKVLGCAGAPHVMIQYSSMSCPHCAEFMRVVFDQIKNDFIDKCKLRYTYREVPNNSPALLASTLAHCMSIKHGSSEVFYKVIKILYGAQDSWAISHNPGPVLREIMLLNNYDKSEVDDCLSNKAYMEGIMARGYEYQRSVGIEYTPLIVIDGKVMPHNTFYNEIKEMVIGGKKQAENKVTAAAKKPEKGAVELAKKEEGKKNQEKVKKVVD